MPFSLHDHRPVNGLRGEIMARPQETYKKRAKEQKRREKQEKKLQRRLDRKEMVPEDVVSGSQVDYAVEPEERP